MRKFRKFKKCYNSREMGEKINFVCKQCGYSSSQWYGKCPNCGEWNSLVEFRETMGRQKTEDRRLKTEGGPKKLTEIEMSAKNRLPTGVEEFDRVVGSGLVPGSVVLLAGEPGIGKSTLLLQIAAEVGKGIKGTRGTSGSEGERILYISGEESAEQIKLRAERLGIKANNLFIQSETNVEKILEEIENLGEDIKILGYEDIKGKEEKKQKPPNVLIPKEFHEANISQYPNILVIIDSVQTLWSENLEGTAGSVSQVKETTAQLINLVKAKNIPLILVGQVTKEGAIAGPMTLAHMVDTVLFLEGERFQSLRLLRGIKNRFGPTDEIGVFEMTEKGMIGVENPAKVFLGPLQAVPGSIIFCAMEGSRPILVEIQALVTKSFLAVPRRVANGIDYNRLVMLTAVLQKSLNLPLWDQDIYLNIAGGFKVSEPAADLAICLAIISSFKNKALPSKTCAFGEVGLLGEVRRVAQEEKREKEVKRLGFANLITSKSVKNLFQANKEF